MNEENKISYYSVIPATVRYDPDLKPAEKLLYSEVTALANKNGYCFAQNKYFADLYNVTNGTVSKWFSHLQKLGYINIEIKRNEKQEILARHIYIVDTPYGQKRPYPYSQKEPYPMVKNDKDNIINNNIDEDDLFYLTIKESDEIPFEFYKILENLDFIYTEEFLFIIHKDKIQMIKDIIYILYDFYNSDFKTLIPMFKRESLINLYILSQEKEPDNLLNYYKRTIINKYTNNST